jgi:hypothetical protein
MEYRATREAGIDHWTGKDLLVAIARVVTRAIRFTAAHRQT